MKIMSTALLSKSAASAPQNNEFVNAKFLADRWGVTLPTIYNWARENRLPSCKLGRTVRFPLAQALAAMEGAAA